MRPPPLKSLFFFFNDTATTEIYTLSLHDALPISSHVGAIYGKAARELGYHPFPAPSANIDRKSTRLNSSHLVISYAVFCLKKKNKEKNERYRIKHYVTRPLLRSTVCTHRAAVVKY